MKIHIPSECPSCQYPLERVNDQLFCRNISCPAQLSGKLLHFTKTLGIKGLGPKALEKLDLADLTEIFYLDVDDLADRLGSRKIAEKLLQEIEGSKLASLDTVIASFSIPLIGQTAGKKVSKVVNNLDQLTTEKCKEAGLGDKATANLMNWLLTEYQELKEFLPFKFETPNSIPSENAKTVCITGKLSSFKTKSEAGIALAQAGFRMVESVTKTLDYLVDEDNKNSSKRQKADEYGIVIIPNLNNFLNEGKTND